MVLSRVCHWNSAFWIFFLYTSIFPSFSHWGQVLFFTSVHAIKTRNSQNVTVLITSGGRHKRNFNSIVKILRIVYREGTVNKTNYIIQTRTKIKENKMAGCSFPSMFFLTATSSLWSAQAHLTFYYPPSLPAVNTVTMLNGS